MIWIKNWILSIHKFGTLFQTDYDMCVDLGSLCGNFVKMYCAPFGNYRKFTFSISGTVELSLKLIFINRVIHLKKRGLHMYEA